jgi:hypothetical protein
MHTETGKTNVIRDRMHISKISDTLVITSMTRVSKTGEFVFSNSLFGKYIGVIPSNLTDVRNRSVTYHKVIRIK